MTARSVRHRLAVLMLVCGCSASAEVTRVEIARRVDVGNSGYEKIVGTLHFAVDPAHPRNRIIADLERAPAGRTGRVEFSSDFFILQPKDAGRSNGTALVEISNRGSRNGLRLFNRGLASDPESVADLGDQFLFRRGFTVVGVGWEFDVPERTGLLRIRVPVATAAGQPITGTVRAAFTVNAPVAEYAVTDLAAYTPSAAADTGRRLTVRGSAAIPGGDAIPPSQWRLRGHTVVLDGGFKPGLVYELSFAAVHPPVAGLGFAAIRDAAAWLKRGGDGVTPVRHALTFGSSQSGRFLRDFLYQGFNYDEAGRRVFDGVLSHIAGAARLDLNRRWSTPRELAMYHAASYPFADTAQPDPVSGRSEGILENPRGAAGAKVFYTNTSVEYWGGGRVAALGHTDPAGTKDVALPDQVRLYVFAGTQHGPSAFPPARVAGGPYGNPVDFGGAIRALLLALHRWVTEDAPPPASAYPLIRDGTLVPPAAVRFPALAGIPSPRLLTAGVRLANPLWPDGAGAGAPLPLLVPQVDDDGNERAGIRLPEVAVPLATATGWTFRPAETGAPDTLVPLRGAWIPFAATRQDRAARQDPRPALDERYASRADYLARVRQAAERLVQQGYLLAEDLDAVVERAGGQWDWLAAGHGR
ncbi:MAG: hypothetical protein JNL92_22775 [Opitutaceae bacterium]|nr:hypothetical protein [Opitutaceae bacterium]